MGLKAVEMQVALPRTQDAGKMQDDAMRQNQHFQDKLTQQQLKQDRLRRKKINEFDNIRKRHVDDEEKETKRHLQEEEEKLKKQKNEQIHHPYLGRYIDYSR